MELIPDHEYDTDKVESDANLSTLVISIDQQWFDERSRSLSALVSSRRCYPHRSSGDMSDILGDIRECCSSQPDYTTHDMPVVEIAFRILLSKEAHSMPFTELHEKLAEKWSGPEHPRSIDQNTLRNILASDNYYGISEI